MNRLTCKTICLTAGMTGLILAGPVHTAGAREQTTFGFYIGVRDYDTYRHYDRNHYRRAYPRRHVYAPRYSYRPYYYRGFYDYRYDYPYRRNYYRRHDNSDRFIATATGVFFGVLIGSELVRYMDDVDRLRIREANLLAQTSPVGTRITWNNAQSYNHGSVTATRDGYSDSGKYCREFHQTVSVGGRTEDAYGIACRQPDGTWRIVQ